MSGFVNGWRTALRIASREARRAKGRSALVVAMIMLPVLALSFAAASYDMFNLTPEEEANRELGTADALVDWSFAGPVRQAPNGDGYGSDGNPRTEPVSSTELLGALPAGSRILQAQEGLIDLRTANGVGTLNAYGVDAADPLVAGYAKLLDGRAPTGDGELAVTERAMKRLGAGIGDTVRNADRTRSWTVTGVVEIPSGLHENVVFPSGHLPTRGSDWGVNRWLWDAPGPVTWEQVKQLNQRGMVVKSRAVLLDPPPASEVDSSFGSSDVRAEAVAVGGLIAGLGVLEVVLLAGPAFAVGARRRQRDLALVAANGGTPAHLRRIVLADGVVLGALGAGAGLVLGVVAAFAGRPLIEEYLTHARAGGYRIFPLALVAIAGVALLTGLLAALVPAFTAARADVVAALTGRRGVMRSRKRWLVLGIALAVIGTATATLGAWRVSSNMILVGLVVGELGLVLCTPSLVGLIARLGRVLPLSPRIALRDTARNRAAAAPAIAAVMAAVAGSVALGVVLTAEEDRNRLGYRPTLVTGNVLVQYYATSPADATHKAPDVNRVAAIVKDSLPTSEVVPLARVICPAGTAPEAFCGASPRIPKERTCPWSEASGPLTRDEQRAARKDSRCDHSYGWSTGGYGLAVGGPEVVSALTGATGDDLARAKATLEAGGALVDDAKYIVDGNVTLELYDPSTDGTITPESQQKLRTITVPGYAVRTGTPLSGTVISPGALSKSGFAHEPHGLVVATSRMPSQAERDQLAAGLRDLDPGLHYSVETGPPRGSDDPTLLILAVAAGLITLGAASIATGLAAADGRADLSTLAAVGASPGVRRRLSLSQSGVIAGLGSVLGVLAGLGASAAVLYAFNRASADMFPAEQPYPIGVPWDSLAVVLVVPLLAMLGAGLLTRSRLPIERRRLT
ncbi:FtsX-like permease family protein [Micromonospora sp. CPCC 206061]|uniref:FtsX-like permease family protein n=1 Tax=Micromonospora sp. CPCC 206061 TaxID=3122410 RepID=UPI002FEE907B